MKANEFIKFILSVRNEIPQTIIDESAAYSMAQITSAGFIHKLCEQLRANDFDVGTITAHIEDMHDSENHFGVIYFLFLIADCVDFELPLQFAQLATNDLCVPILSSVLIEDLLEDYLING